MNKEKTLRYSWLFTALVIAIGIAAFVYASTDLNRCFWSNIDSDFCYSVAGLRYMEGLRSGFIEHSSSGVGMPIVQLLTWTYTLASKTGMLSTGSFQGLAVHSDPLLYLRQFVIVGWLSGVVVFLLIVAIVFYFVRFLTRSNPISFLAAIIVAVSWSNLQFLLRIREEAFSASMGLLSLYLTFRAVRSSRLSVSGYSLVFSGVALAFALFAKRNALPYLAFLPLVFVLVPENSWDRVQDSTRNMWMKHAFVANLFLLGPLVLLVRYWPEFIASFTIILVPYVAVEILGFILLLVLWLLLIFCTRLHSFFGRGQMRLLMKRGVIDAAMFALLVTLGFEIAVYASFIHPILNVYSLFLATLLTVGLVWTLVVRQRRQKGTSVALDLFSTPGLIPRNDVILIIAAIVWIVLWQLARFSPEAFGPNIEVAVSRVIFELLHPQSSVSALSMGDYSSPLMYIVGVFAELWSHYRIVRWHELLIVILTLFELFLSRKTSAIRTILFLVLAATGLMFFSALRHLFPFYVIYGDILFILAVSLCFSQLVIILRGRMGGEGSKLRVSIVFSLAITMLVFSVLERTKELRSMEFGVDVVGCSSPPSGDTCLCDEFYAGTKYGGTGLKGILERQYGDECNQAVKSRAADGIP